MGIVNPFDVVGPSLCLNHGTLSLLKGSEPSGRSDMSVENVMLTNDTACALKTNGLSWSTLTMILFASPKPTKSNDFSTAIVLSI